MAQDKKNAEDLGAHLVFLDESGFLLIPTVRRTWGLRGRATVHRHRQKRRKVSVISALTLSPRRRRIGLYFRSHPEANICNGDVADFLRHLLKHLRGFIIVLWDNGRHHKGEAIRRLCRRSRRLRLEPLPAYAPELNPDEGVWNQARTALANGRPDDAGELAGMLREVMTGLGRSQPKLRWCFHQSGLPFFLP